MTTRSEGESAEERHHRKMTAKKRVRDKILSTKTIEKGLVIVHTGKGKGKTTAAMGLVVRALGQNLRVGIVQFVKGAWETGERKVLENFKGQCTIKAMGEGFSWETQDLNRDKQAARQAFDLAKQMVMSDDYDLVLLDEINIVLRSRLIGVGEVLSMLESRDKMKHVVLTGRNAPDELLEVADLVTEMVSLKHPFRSGVKAQVGIEF